MLVLVMIDVFASDYRAYRQTNEAADDSKSCSHKDRLLFCRECEKPVRVVSIGEPNQGAAYRASQKTESQAFQRTFAPVDEAYIGNIGCERCHDLLCHRINP